MVLCLITAHAIYPVVHLIIPNKHRCSCQEHKMPYFLCGVGQLFIRTAIRQAWEIQYILFIQSFSGLFLLLKNIQKSTWAPPVLHSNHTDTLAFSHSLSSVDSFNCFWKSSAYSILGTRSDTVWEYGGREMHAGSAHFQRFILALSLTVSSDCVIWRTSVTQTSHLLIHFKLRAVVITGSNFKLTNCGNTL